MTKIRLDYEDDVIDMVETISNALEAYGLSLVFDGEEHDGFEICEIVELEDEE